jgi:glycosyltransferase involved in cell wall biosynthesis
VNHSEAVTILLSTYNGAKFLRVQLDSILAQSYPNLLIHIRDDGSTDATHEILRGYARSHPSIQVNYSSHVGVVPSYLSLLAEAKGACEFFAFAGQDDFWPATKIANAVAELGRHDRNQPLLYFSAVEYVDAQMNHLGYSKPPRRLGFGNALVENAAVGATFVINQKARSIVLSTVPRQALMEDWWMYLVVSAFGKVIYDDRPGLKYRQHAANIVGWQHGFDHTILSSLANLLRPYRVSPTFSDQAKDFLRCHGSRLGKRDYDTIAGFLASRRNLWSRAMFAARMNVWRQSRIENLKLRAQVIAGRY